MFDISWTELMVIGVVALLVVGPKELPALLRTIGRYVGKIKQQAAEFRAQLDEAMRESEFESLKKDVEGAGRDMETTVRDAGRSVQTEIHDARRHFNHVGHVAVPERDANCGMSAPPAIETTSDGTVVANPSVNGAGTTPAPPTGEAQAKPGA